jgi:hypothetical protein
MVGLAAQHGAAGRAGAVEECNVEHHQYHEVSLRLQRAGLYARGADQAIPLVAPGSRFLDRVVQLDLGMRRVFRIRERMSLSAQLDVFNVNNSHAVLIETQNLGTSGANTFTGLVSTFRDGGPGGTPTTLLTPRILRLAVQFKF